MALVSRTGDRPDPATFLGRAELGEMLTPAAVQAYRTARARLVAGEALELALVAIAVACAALLLDGHLVIALLVAAVALPAGGALRFVRTSFRRIARRARELAQWGRVRYRVSVRSDAGESIAAAVSCAVDADGAHRAMLEGGVARSEVTELSARRFASDAEVELYEAVAELEADVARREDGELTAFLEREAERRDQLEDESTREEVIGHLRFRTGGWR